MSSRDLKKIFAPIVENYSDEEVQEMKALGVPKPDGVTWGQWVGPKKESHVHEALIYMAASGATNKQIADDLGFTQSRISIILSKPSLKEKVRKVQEELWGDSAEKRFKNLLPKAIDTWERILNDTSEKSALQSDVASKVADRVLGKPKQEVSVAGNLLGDLISRLDQQQTRDVTDSVSDLKIEKRKDDAEKFFDDFLGEKKLVIGKRDNNG